MNLLNSIFLGCLLLFSSSSLAQAHGYSPGNLHSHNDYDRPDPFYTAFRVGAGSIEADIFLHNEKLLVGHEKNELEKRRNLEKMYLHPLQKMIRKNGNYLSAGHKRSLILMIDIKSAARPTLDSLVQLLKKYPELIATATLKIAISGSRPSQSEWNLFPDFIYFDGIVSNEYPDSLLNRIAMFSDDFKKYSNWNGIGSIPQNDLLKLKSAVNKIHGKNKMIRFWNAPDTKEAWNMFISIGADLINTDKVEEVAEYLLKRD